MVSRLKILCITWCLCHGGKTFSRCYGGGIRGIKSDEDNRANLDSTKGDEERPTNSKNRIGQTKPVTPALTNGPSTAISNVSTDGIFPVPLATPSERSGTPNAALQVVVEISTQDIPTSDRTEEPRASPSGTKLWVSPPVPSTGFPGDIECGQDRFQLRKREGGRVWYTMSNEAARDAELIVGNDCKESHWLVDHFNRLQKLSLQAVAPTPLCISPPFSLGYDSYLGCDRERRLLLVANFGDSLASLRNSSGSQGVPLLDVFKIGLNLVRAVEAVHLLGVISAHLSPETILLEDRENHHVQIMAFRSGPVKTTSGVSGPSGDMRELFRILADLNPVVYQVAEMAEYKGENKMKIYLQALMQLTLHHKVNMTIDYKNCKRHLEELIKLQLL